MADLSTYDTANNAREAIVTRNMSTNALESGEGNALPLSEPRLKQMALDIERVITNKQYGADGLELQDADIAWPDGADGTFTVDTWNDTWFVVDKWTATYDPDEADKTIVWEVTQRNAVGEIINQNITVS